MIQSLTAYFGIGTIALATIALGCTGSSESIQPKPGTLQAAPDFVLRTVAGDTLRLSSQKGRVILLNFWATWCAPCRFEQPILNDLYEQYRDQGLDVWGVSVNSNRLAVELWIENMQVPYPVMVSSDEDRQLLIDYGANNVVPQSVLIDRKGNIHKTYPGALTSVDSLGMDLKPFLGLEI